MPMEKLSLTRQQACRFMLAHQGLWPPRSLKDKDGILKHIKRVGCIQFDPLNIVGRNPELVLQSRISGYKPKLLEDLLYRSRNLIDGWDKQMSIYSVEDWPYFKRYREKALRNFGHENRPAAAILPQVREEIEKRGPISSLDLDFEERVNWAWAPTSIARAALESMYFWGEVIIHHKVNTRRIYDFSRKHIPETILSAADPNKSEEQYHDWYVLRRIGGIGLMWAKSSEAWLGCSDIKSKERSAAINRLLNAGKLLEVNVEGIRYPLYMRMEDKETLDAVLTIEKVQQHAAIIAPLDNLLWDRNLVKELFDFEYRWEVYKPEAERKYGYYVLPVLYGDRFVARFEPGQDKKNRVLIIKNWWWEPGVKPSKGMNSKLAACFKKFINYLELNKIYIDDKLIQDLDLRRLTDITN